MGMETAFPYDGLGKPSYSGSSKKTPRAYASSAFEL